MEEPSFTLLMQDTVLYPQRGEEIVNIAFSH